MGEVVGIIAGIIASIVGALTIAWTLVYTKTDVDKKLTEINDKNKKYVDEKKKDSIDRIEKIANLVSDSRLEARERSSRTKDEIYDKLNENKAALEDGMKQFINILTDIKQADKDMSLQFITMINTVKEELKNDYTSRYNDLLVLINSKANESDFNRLEQKFDKFSETIVELKTIVQLQIEDKNK